MVSLHSNRKGVGHHTQLGWLYMQLKLNISKLISNIPRFPLHFSQWYSIAVIIWAQKILGNHLFPLSSELPVYSISDPVHSPRSWCSLRASTAINLVIILSHLTCFPASWLFPNHVYSTHSQNVSPSVLILQCVFHSQSWILSPHAYMHVCMCAHTHTHTSMRV